MANWIWKKYNATENVTYTWRQYDTTLQYTWRQYDLKAVHTYRDDRSYYGSRSYGSVSGGYARYTFNTSTGQYTLLDYSARDQFNVDSLCYVKSGDGINQQTFGSGTGLSEHRAVIDSTNYVKSTYLSTVTSTSSTTYPTNGQSGSYWYDTRTSSPVKSTYLGTVTSTSSTAYPTNGESGNYWYDTRTSSTSYSQGSYIGEVTAEETAFTDNARHSDGYWYVKDRLANVAPTISGSDEDLGTKINPFTRTFFVDDLDLTQTLNVVVKLNNSVIRTIDNASRKENYTVDINQARFDGLTIDVRNTIEISVTDTSGATAVRRWYFTRINTNPTVSVTMSNLGEQNSPFSFKFTADDADGDDITAKIFIDDVQLADLGTITKGQEQTYSLEKLDYSKITNGTHKIKIEVTDSKNARGYGFVDFSKNITFARYKFTKEVTAQASTIIVNLMAEIAQGATVTIKVCNNAFDTNPTWETVPEELHGQAYNFQNTTKTAAQWGIGVEVRIDRATATKDSYFYGFVGAYS